MAKIDIKRILEIKREMGVLKNFFDVDYLLFLFGFKPTVIIFLNEKNNTEFDLTINIYISFSEKCAKKRVYAYDFRDKKGIKDAFILSYSKINKKDLIPMEKFDHKKLGETLGYPKCCIEKFIEDYKGDRATSMTWDSAKRYVKQLKELEIKEDPFEIKISKNGILMYSKIDGFIPCSPKCKEALKMIDNYKLINEILNKNG